ncbi:retrovirus-related Pol polyprotein [Trachinotus anak]|uniref:retrovirus-related Pol polyprotein n=1 Tax=Trachinotus anak TaxID=443729 RepID=UPI0039F1A47C
MRRTTETDYMVEVKAALPRPAETKLHDLNVGDYIVVKDFRRKNWKARRWNGPFQVLLVTETAVKVAERATWIHASHCRRVPDPNAQHVPDREAKTGPSP